MLAVIAWWIFQQLAFEALCLGDLSLWFLFMVHVSCKYGEIWLYVIINKI